MRWLNKKWRENGIKLKATTDAKYLEAGMTLKSDNVDYFMECNKHCGIEAKDCCLGGDEFTFLGEGIPGSDAYMITEQTKRQIFF